MLKLDVHDQGGHGRFVTPDGRKLEITLHSDDWPFAVERDALILVLRDQGAEVPFATAWSSVDEEDIALSLSWLRILPRPRRSRSGRVERGPQCCACWTKASISFISTGLNRCGTSIIRK